VKKVFQLTDPKKHADRVLEAVKHDIRKYTKREKRKELADPESTYWDFDCKIGATEAEAETIAYKELLKALETIQSTGAAEVYIEIMAKAVPKPPKPIKEEVVEEVPVKEAQAEDSVSSEPAD
jgi:hypothetical protein